MQATSPTFARTRIAPTPSGYLHLGNVLSFALTAVIAHKTNAKILLRIDDLDRLRTKDEYVQDIFDTLEFMEIPYQEGPRNLSEYRSPWSQSQRTELYNQALTQLAEKQLVFACTCTRADVPSSGIYPGKCLHKNLPLNTPGASWRLKTSVTEIPMKTYVSKTSTAVLPADMQNFVVRKKDGFPAYQLTSLCDDIYFGVDLIVRGHDLCPSTLAQLQLAEKIGETMFLDTTFYHHPLLMGDGGQKLSKSAGDTSIKYLRQQGKTPADIYGMIALQYGINVQVANWAQLRDVLGWV